jgi:hypothetical protein
MWEVSSSATDLSHQARLQYVTFELERVDG